MAATFLVVHVFWYCGISRFFVCRLRHQSWYFSRDIASFCLDLVSLHQIYRTRSNFLYGHVPHPPVAIVIQRNRHHLSYCSWQSGNIYLIIKIFTARYHILNKYNYLLSKYSKYVNHNSILINIILCIYSSRRCVHKI